MKTESTVRVFLALPLAPFFLKEIESYLLSLEKAVPHIKWVRPDQVHITLHFFGSIVSEEISKIKDLVLPLHHNHEPMKISLQNFGCFPNLQRPSVFWLGVKEENESLVPFQRGVEKTFEKAGYPVEKRAFHPHATLGRVRREDKPPHLDWAWIPPFMATSVKVIDYTLLYQSHLETSGARYEALETFAFAEKPAPQVKRTS